MVHVVTKDFDVVDGVLSGDGFRCLKLSEAGFCSKSLSNAQVVGSDKLLLIFAPERMIGRAANGFRFAVDLQFQSRISLMAECARDDLPFTIKDLRAGFDRMNPSIAIDAAFGHADVDVAVNDRLFLFNPVKRSQQCDCRNAAVGFLETSASASATEKR